MSDQEHSHNPQSIAIQLEIVPEDEQDADPVAMGDVGRSVVDALRRDGYTIQPAYTGERGGILFEIVSFLQATVQIAITHKDLLIEMFKAASPIAKHFVEEGEKHLAKAATHGHIKVEIGIEGNYIQAEATDFAGNEQIIKLANKFLERYSSTIEHLTPRSTVKIRGSVPKRQTRRRR